MNEEIIPQQVQLSQLDWDKLSMQFQDLRFILEYGPASFNEEGDSYLASINEQFKTVSPYFTPLEENGVVSPSPFSVYLDTMTELTDQVSLIQENQILLTEQITLMQQTQTEMLSFSETMNASTVSIEGSVMALTESEGTTSTILVDEVSGIKNNVSNILTFSAWAVSMAVVVAVSYWLYKKVIFKWINQILRFRI